MCVCVCVCVTVIFGSRIGSALRIPKHSHIAHMKLVQTSQPNTQRLGKLSASPASRSSRVMAVEVDPLQATWLFPE